jgi:hypothetical protein
VDLVATVGNDADDDLQGKSSGSEVIVGQYLTKRKKKGKQQTLFQPSLPQLEFFRLQS